MVSEHTAERLTSLCYEAVHDPGAWHAFLSGYCEAVDASVGGIYVPPIDGYSSAPFVIHNTEPLERVLEILPKFMHAAPFVSRAIEKGLAPGVFVYSDLYSTDELTEMDHVSVYMRQADVLHGLQMLLQRGDRRVPPISVGVLRPWKSNDFGEAERLLSSALFPHVRRAARLSLQADLSPAFDPALGDAFDQYATPSFLFRFDGRVLHANRAARATLACGGALSLRDGTLKCADATVQRKLNAAIEMAIGFDWSWSGRVGADVVLPPGEDGAVRVACVVPLGPDNPFLGWVSAVRASVYILEGSAPHAAPGSLRRLQGLFDLTATEAEIAALLIGGVSIDDIASRRSVSSSTVRQHTKAILAKTESHRQAELARFRPLIEGPR